MDYKKNNQNIDVKYLVNVILRHWLLILISIILCLSVAIVYLKLSSNSYLVGAKILINVDEQRVSSGSSEYFDVNELMSRNKSLQNELVYLQSTPLIKEVIDDMNLITSYYMQEGRIPIPSEFMFTLTDIYKQSPFIVVLDKNHRQPLNTLFYIVIRDDATYRIGGTNEYASIFDFNNEKVVNSEIGFNLRGIYKFGETVENEYCSFKILLNSNYNPAQFMEKQLFFKFNSTAQLANMFRYSLFLRTNERESTMVDMSFEWSNIELAIDFLNKLVNKYIEKSLEDKNRLANNTIEYIDQQLSNISGSLGRSEQQLQNFRSSYDVMSIDEKSRNLSTQIYNLELDRDNQESNYRDLAQIREYFETNKDVANFIAPSLLGIQNEVLGTLIQEMAQLTNEKQELINKNQLKSPRLRTLNPAIENIKRVISENINFNITAAENEIQDIKNRITSLNRDFSRLPQTQRRLTGLEREFNITDAAYTAMLNKRIEAQIARASNQPDCEIIEPVRFQAVTYPKPMNIITFAIMLGLLFPMLFILARIFLTDKITNRDEIRRFSSLKQVGNIPHSDNKLSNVIISEPHAAVSEAFLTVKSNMVYYLFGESNKTILITSSVPNEGKSFTSLNLATSFASTHNKTLLVNFDLRKGSSVFSELKAKDNVGISSYLINKATLVEIINPTEIPNLDFIDSGVIPPDPVALISSPKTKELFNKLKKSYDYIIIDSPPYDLVTDSFLLMNFSDIKLFVSRIGTVTRKALRSCMNDFNLKSIDNIYLMLNDVKNMNGSKYSYYTDTTKKKGLRRFLSRRK